MSEEKNYPTQENPQDKLSFGLAVLSFLIPIVGIVIYFSDKSEKPNKAKSACNAALWSIGIGVVLNIIAALIAGV